ncbi:hypothetical protein H8B02_32705 [Bradyrhizobium sp. Pear77]|uniref:hypothetical protein n=1 Tax=Bradyrhizobium TaxID=374 RepID=UPI001E4691A0|nr:MULTISPECIES: hypothetical protein [Bradyrhizobium]MCC8958018.1 hypothetical protein [Bradyrhizobium altum]MCC8967123.1 hypothetical protein [Bradyrhizobium oropedii]
MQAKGLGDLLIDYVSWRSRYVGQRPRTVSVEPAACADLRWAAHSDAIEIFLEKMRRGDDLMPHLSIAPRTRGYAPAARAQNAPPADRWSDKDFVLNAMGYHHFHLGQTIHPRGHVDRTNDLIVAEVHREKFHVIAIFGHEVFDHDSAERMRLWSAHDKVAFGGMLPGSVAISALNTTFGHTLHSVHYAKQCAKWIRRLEPLLDGPISAAGLYARDHPPPPRPKFSWTFDHLDFFITEEVEPTNFVLMRGWN